MSAPLTLVRKSWEIRRPGRRHPVRGDLRVVAGIEPRSAVIICHGFKGFRRFGFFPSLARAIAMHGHAAVTFDFTHNGVGDDGVDFTALDRFAKNTHSGNLEEIEAVIDMVSRGDGALLPAAPDKIALLGHSRGGTEALLAASVDVRVNALVTWAAFSSIEKRWTPEQIATWQTGGTVMVMNARTHQQMPVGPAYWDDFVHHRDRLDIEKAAGSLRIPWLIVHGDADETVDVEEARRLLDASGQRARLVLVEGGSHGFGGTHPYAGPTPGLRRAAGASLEWLDTLLLADASAGAS
jgi:dienelactone hydrolase